VVVASGTRVTAIRVWGPGVAGRGRRRGVGG